LKYDNLKYKKKFIGHEKEIERFYQLKMDNEMKKIKNDNEMMLNQIMLGKESKYQETYNELLSLKEKQKRNAIFIYKLERS